jgi:hypothetical protein
MRQVRRSTRERATSPPARSVPSKSCANERAQFARPVPQQQSTQNDHFMTNPGAPQGVGGAAAQSASPAATAPVVAKDKTTDL